jgi:capsular exopolysaccharide synthesis family protein
MRREPFEDPRLPARAPVAPRAVVTAEPVYYQPEYATEPASEEGLLRWWKVLQRQKGVLLVTMALGGIAGFLYTAPQTPIYRAATTVEVQSLNENFLNMKDVSPTSTGSSWDPSYDITTQVRLMQSQALMERATAKLKTQRGDEVTYPTDRLSRWKKALGLKTNEGVRQAGLAIGAVSIRPVGDTRIIEVTAESPDPALAADYANTLVNEFIDLSLESRWKSTERTGEWLTKQLEEIKIRLERSEDALQAYASSVGLQFTGATSKDGAKENVAEEKLRQLQQEMLKAQSERVAAQSRHELVASSPAESLPQVLDDATLRGYQSKLTELKQRHAELSASWTAEHPQVLKVQAQIGELEAALKKERANVVTRIRNDFEAAQRREKLLAAEYGSQSRVVMDQGGKAIHYNILQREVETNRQLYESMLQKVKEAGIASAMRASMYRVVDPAKPPSAPFKPNPTRSATMGSLAGVLLGAALVLARERIDRSIQQPGDAPLYLNLPELGVIPSERIGTGKRIHGRTVTPVEGEANSLDLVTWNRKPSLLAESFRLTLTSILFSGASGEKPQVIALSSSGPSEGKTTVTSNLAIALAEINRRVLLIDADMRRPRLHLAFGISNEQGLSDLLKDKEHVFGRKLVSWTQATQVPGLFLLPSGHIANNASNLLYSPRLGELIAECRNQFDAILIDTPPLLHLADARVVGRHCDRMILVVRAGKTTRDAAQAAIKKLQEDGTPVMGTILNDWNPGSHGYGYTNKYYDGYSKYYRNPS